MTNCIRTASGVLFNPLEPDFETFDLNVIAHALSHICRFTGHTRTFYSVAQHSVIVAELLADQYTAAHGLYGLLHDASEAYIADVSRPVKHHPSMRPYRDLEARLQAAIYRSFGLSAEEPEMVKAIDTFVLDVEMRDLMEGADPVHRIRASVHPPIVPMDSELACLAFLRCFSDLHPRLVAEGV